jgi:hypothetical protein
LCSARPAVAPYLRRQPEMAASIVAHLRTLASPRDAEGQRRFGITPGGELLGIRAPVDERNFVKKAVNWALRQIGKRNPRLRRAAIAEAEEIRRLDSRSARWIAADALRELKRRLPSLLSQRTDDPPKTLRPFRKA